MIKRISLCSIFLACCLLTSCNLADGLGNDVEENVVYMHNPNKAGTISIMAADDGFEQTISPRLSQPAAEDVEIEVAVDPEALQRFNDQNNLKLMPISADDIVLTNEQGQTGKGSIKTIIKKGDVQSLVKVSMSKIDPEKYPYSAKLAVALSLKSASLPILSSPNNTIITLNRKITTSVFHMINPNGGGYSLNFSPETTYTGLSEWTFQFIVQVNDIHGNNQTTGSLAGGAGFYNRIHKTSGFQCKSEGRDGMDTWTNKPINEAEWLHVTYIYRQSGLAGKVSIYVNGELQHTFTTSPLEVQGGEGFGFGNENLRDYYLREVRFWNRALTDAEILDKIYLPEPADSPGLEACFPMTRETYDEEAGVFKDIKGNWKFRVTAKGNNINSEIVDNVVFPAKSLTIEEPASAPQSN